MRPSVTEDIEDLLKMTDLGGIFYPRGYFVAAFPKREDARRVRRNLLAGGYERHDCMLFGAKEIARMARRNLEEHRGFLARLGRSDEILGAQLEAAERGHAFLVIYAPDDLEAKRAMNVVRRVPFDFVHHYHRLAVQILK